LPARAERTKPDQQKREKAKKLRQRDGVDCHKGPRGKKKKKKIREKTREPEGEGDKGWNAGINCTKKKESKRPKNAKNSNTLLRVRKKNYKGERIQTMQSFRDKVDKEEEKPVVTRGL